MKILNDEHDLINDNELDEMQKTYAYKLAFKCFKALYWSVFALSLIMLIIAVAVEDSVIFGISAIVMELVANIIYIIFGAKASKIGAMNPKFAKNMAKPGTIIGYFMLAIIYIIMYVRNFINDGDIFYIFAGLYLLIVIGTFIILGFVAKKNNKVIEETEEE
ncbi:MAG: hypothetical protein IJX15_04475 [Ruminiclostridium sp.]|nr:hypothetical protein [Ruminiclostridium sp.]